MSGATTRTQAAMSAVDCDVAISPAATTRLAAHYPDQERNTDIDQELHAAADVARIEPAAERAIGRLRPCFRHLAHALRPATKARSSPRPVFGRRTGSGPRFFRNPERIVALT
jgi:hypothetical protein